jgi:hypothetical protein
MQATHQDPAIQLLQMRGHVLNVFSSFPGGEVIGVRWSLDQIVDHLSPIVSGMRAHEDALEFGKRTLAAITGFAAAPPGDENKVLASAVVAFQMFRKKEEALCPVIKH